MDEWSVRAERCLTVERSIGAMSDRIGSEWNDSACRQRWERMRDLLGESPNHPGQHYRRHGRDAGW